MKDQICVVIETIRGEITELSFSMLAAGRVLADGLGTGLTALLAGRGVKSLAGRLGAADKVACVDDAALADFSPEAHLRVIAGVMHAAAPRVAVLGHTTIGTDLACGVASRLKAPIVTSCQAFEVTDGAATYSSLTCGGKIIASGTLPDSTCVVTMMPGGYKAEQGQVNGSPPVQELAMPGVDSPRTSFKQWIEPDTSDVDIAKEPVLISVGRGIQNQDNIALAQTLAEALGGVVAGSRPVVDQGWLPTTRMVGKSGKAVKPKLYLALGISGAPEHAEGMRDAGCVVAVNTDEKAPIFDFAKYGAAVDVLDLLPVLTEKVKAARG